MWEKWDNSQPKPTKVVSLRPEPSNIITNDPDTVPDQLVEDQYANLSNSLGRTGDRLVNILEEIRKSSRVQLSQTNTLIVDGSDTGIKANDFIRAVGQSSLQSERHQKKIPVQYRPIIEVLALDPDLVTNPHAIKGSTGRWSNFKL